MKCERSNDRLVRKVGVNEYHNTQGSSERRSEHQSDLESRKSCRTRRTSSTGLYFSAYSERILYLFCQHTDTLALTSTAYPGSIRVPRSRARHRRYVHSHAHILVTVLAADMAILWGYCSRLQRLRLISARLRSPVHDRGPWGRPHTPLTQLTRRRMKIQADLTPS